ncbi:NAD-dependent epimerase/dehydratase family protein [Motilimonas sp. 1_MG-2023]|uniref:NAD-dependent epimerase/dehydratase family protein n=1 Tax=Motilimonas sp. 1_MG-2023 TaxID=3062672 RepID=UPI0026E4967F|nr:NAD-dependent epimerase/dehydratase family protein [Motilimonas sp. 1_MG-2023]MDO6527437.1 NAD-dependent epimerase/dehydratase family protein [Motilimonas sp. 1_MG-2023]
MQVLLTGSSGFVGSHLKQALMELDVKLTVLNRCLTDTQCVDAIYVPTFDGNTLFQLDKFQFDVVIHCAAINHDVEEEKLDLLRQVNVEGTLNLATQAAKAGIKRFIFISTAKVNGETTENREAFCETDKPNPQGSYAKSKYDAEEGLKVISAQTGMEYVIVRPPLVYGPRGRGNFSSILNCVYKRVPLPFYSLDGNRRSFISVGNLVSFISLCANHPQAGNQVFLVSDDDDVSTKRLFDVIASCFKVYSLNYPVPKRVILSISRILKKEHVVTRVTDSLQVNISKAKKRLGWLPPGSFESGVQHTVDDFILKRVANKIKKF